MPATITRSPRKATPRSDKVSVTLRIPTELKSWADEFASKSHLDLSGLFIQSLRETQQR